MSSFSGQYISKDATGLPIVNMDWASQSTWTIDPINGNDSNTGEGVLQEQTIVFSANLITGNSISIDFANIDLEWETLTQAFDTDNATTLQALTDLINGNISATADYDGVHTIIMTGFNLGSSILTNRASVIGGVSQANITITETVSAFSNALATWGELRRRLRAVGGNTAAIDIYISPIYSGDPLITDWEWSLNIPVILHGTPSIIRNGSFTGLSLRNPALNLPNIITDSSVSNWASDIGFTSGRHLCMTSGLAAGFCAGIVKDLGSHQARTGSFYNTLNFVEVNPANGDKYCIIGKPFVQDFAFIQPSGFLEIRHMDFGNDASSLASVGDGSNGGVEFTCCSVFLSSLTNAFVYNVNSILKYCPSIYNGQIQNLAGVIGDITNSLGQNEVEQGGEFVCESGTLFQGVGLSAIDNGFVRIYDAGIFDVTNAPGFGISCGNGGNVRLEKIWGSGNSNTGVLVTNVGQIWGNLSQCTITGSGGEVYFCGQAYTWASILAQNGIEASKGFGGISYGSATEIAVAGKMCVLPPITGINLKNTGQTNIFTVPSSSPSGKQFYLKDIILVPTTASAVTVAPQARVGKTAGFNDWMALTTLTGLNALKQQMSLAEMTNGAIRSIYIAGESVKIDVALAATATSLIVTAFPIGFFL